MEISNVGERPVNMDGIRITGGIEYTFPTGTLLEGGAYLVVAADPTQFAAVYPEVQNVIGGWGGKLSKKGERICLSDAQGNEITEVSYASEGDWGVRKLFYDPHSGLSGWDWYAPHNGEGCSLELVNPLRPITIGQNWEASENPGGTPGAVNSRFRSGMDQAPLISEPTHSPVIPTEGEQVRVSVRITAEPGSSPSGALLWRVSAEEEFTQTLLKDDGDREKSGDLIAGDGVYTALLPGQTVGTVTEFYFTAWMEENKISVGINIDEDTKRYYPYSTVASNVIGFCGSDNQGLSGIESKWDSVLTGTPGKIVSSQGSDQQEIPDAEETYIAAENGSDLTLTIDLNIQTIVEKYLKQAVEENECSRGGNVIAMDPSTGDILAMASYPDYDLNSPYTPNSTLAQTYDSLSTEEKSEALYRMWANKSVAETYEPGSTFKVITSSNSS